MQPLPHPKNLILNLLLAAKGTPFRSKSLVGAAALFGISENSVRVTLVRLSAAGLIESSSRGAYVLGPRATAMTRDLVRWRTKEDRACDWTGGWLMVSTAGLSRSDRVALRIRQRALALVGFQPLSEGLYIRPDNLTGHAEQVRQRLHHLGLEPSAPIFGASQLDEALESTARQLWDGEVLNARYRHTRLALEHWLERAPSLPLAMAARESYLLGNEAIRHVLFDPLLPEPLVNVAERRAFVNAVLQEEELGQKIWRGLMARLGDGDISLSELQDVARLPRLASPADIAMHPRAAA